MLKQTSNKKRAGSPNILFPNLCCLHITAKQQEDEITCKHGGYFVTKNY